MLCKEYTYDARCSDTNENTLLSTAYTGTSDIHLTLVGSTGVWAPRCSFVIPCVWFCTHTRPGHFSIAGVWYATPMKKPEHQRKNILHMWSSLIYKTIHSLLLLLRTDCHFLSVMCGRIPYEENVLLACYGEEYATYMDSTIIGIPFVSTVQLKKKRNMLGKNQTSRKYTETCANPTRQTGPDCEHRADQRSGTSGSIDTSDIDIADITNESKKMS